MADFIALYNQTNIDGQDITADEGNFINLTVTGSEKFSNLGAGILQSNSSGNISSSYTIPNNITVNNIYPSLTATYNLGHPIYKWLTAYINNIISSSITTDTFAGTTNTYITTASDFRPSINSSWNLGSSSLFWGNLYCTYITVFELLDTLNPSNFNIQIDSTNNRIRFNVGGSHVDIAWASRATVISDDVWVDRWLLTDTIKEYTTGNGTTINSVLIKTGTIQSSSYTTGVLHSNSSGAITSSSVINTDISSGATSSGYSLTADGSGGASWTATTATTIDTTQTTSNLSYYLIFVDTPVSSSSRPVYVNASLSYNPSTATLATANMTATTFTGALSGTATNANNIQMNSYTSSSQFPIVWAGALTGYTQLYDISTFNFNPNTGVMNIPQISAGSVSSAFTGALTGNVTGNCTGSSGSCTGNSATATTATTASNVVTTATSTNASYYPVFVSSSSSSSSTGLDVDVDLTYNPSTNTLTVPNLTVGSTAISHDGNPVGTIIMWSTATAPTNYLLCDGSNYATASFATLFAVIGHAYGGTGSNFNVPDMLSRMPIGAGAGSGLTTRTFPTNAGNSHGGAETVTLASTDIPAHLHGVGTLASNVSLSNNTNIAYDTGSACKNSIQMSGSAVGQGGTVSVTNGAMTGSTANSTASSTNPAIMNPFCIITFCIKYQ